MTNELKCRYCKAPIRHPGCQSHCEHYLKWKEEYDKLKSVEKKQIYIDYLGRPNKKKKGKQF